MHFQQIYRFEVDLLKKFAMSFRLEQSLPTACTIYPCGLTQFDTIVELFAQKGFNVFVRRDTLFQGQ